MTRPLAVLAGLSALALAAARPALAREYFIGGPVRTDHMEIVANYLVGIEMAPMPAGMPMGPGVIHLEADVHATGESPWGHPDGAWIPYLTIAYTLAKQGGSWQSTGRLLPMTAGDGPHYAANVKMDGPGEYRLTYRFTPPEANGFLRHTDSATGVPAWWMPFSESFSFRYPQP